MYFDLKTDACYFSKFFSIYFTSNNMQAFPIYVHHAIHITFLYVKVISHSFTLSSNKNKLHALKIVYDTVCIHKKPQIRHLQS